MKWKQLDESVSLKSFVENQAYQYIGFNTEKRFDFSKTCDNISRRNDTEIIIRNFLNVKNPLIVINQYPLDKLNVLEFIILENIKRMNLNKPSDKLSEIYSSLAKYRLINITMNERNWRKLKRKYGR